MNELEILKFCTNYNNIIKCDFAEDDILTKKIIEIYEEYIFQIDIASRKEVKFIKDLDEAMNYYVEDYRFSKKIKSTLDADEITKKNFKFKTDLLVYIVDYYKKYQTKKAKEPVITEWI